MEQREDRRRASPSRLRSSAAAVVRLRKQEWWLVTRGLLRAAVSAAVMVAAYYVVPFEDLSDRTIVMYLVAGLALFATMLTWQLRAIVRSRKPAVRAIQALATATALFLLLFASTYFILGDDDPENFSQPLDRSSAIYFTVTVFSTVGFGDITAQTVPARIVVTIQMLLDLVILGLGIQVLLQAVRRGRSSQDADDGEPVQSAAQDDPGSA